MWRPVPEFFKRRRPDLEQAGTDSVAWHGRARVHQSYSGDQSLAGHLEPQPWRQQAKPADGGHLRDEAETWETVRNLEDAPDDAWAYPAVTWIEDQAYITYFNYQGGHSLLLKTLPASWFYD